MATPGDAQDLPRVAGRRAPWRRVAGWWDRATTGTAHPVRHVATLAGLGLASGLLEFLTMVLLIALATGHDRLGWALPGWLTGARALLALAALCAGAASAWVNVTSARLTSRLGAAALATLRDRLTRGFLAADWTTQRAEPAGRLQDLAFADAGQVSLGTQHAAEAVAGTLRLATFVGLAFAVSPLATGAVMIGVGVVAVTCSRLGGRRAQAASRQAADAGSDYAAALTEAAAVAGELRVFNVRGAAAEALSRREAVAGHLSAQTLYRAALTPRLSRDLAVVALTVVLFAVLEVEDLALPTLGLVLMLAMRALGLASSLAATAHQVRERLAHLDRVDEHLGRWAPARPGTGVLPRPAAPGNLRLDSVEVVYPGSERPALTGVSLTLRPGEQLGVVGPSGSGKSTLACLLLGLVEPTRGRLLVDGVDRARIDPACWFTRLAAALQQPLLVTGTVADNIRFLRPGLDDAQVTAAAVAGGLGPELSAWHGGIDTATGVHGQSLSGGQRQRVTLARALACPADLLVLDEPSSALDASAELALREALDAVDPATTVVVVAHRLSTVLGCDRVAVLEEGRLTALAPPAELAAADGYFRDALRLSQAEPRRPGAIPAARSPGKSESRAS